MLNRLIFLHSIWYDFIEVILEMTTNNAKYITSNHITFKYAKGASSEYGKEFHSFHEIIYFMGGDAKFISENMQVPIKPNTLIVIPRETYHQFMINGSQMDYHRCVFHFTDIPELKELINTSMKTTLLIEMNSNFHFLFEQMIAFTEPQASSEVVSVLMKSVLSLILNEIASKNYVNIEKSVPKTISDKCTAYIAKHINEPISVEDIANELNVSVSHLAHSFKKQMNISIHQYILKKKLVIAHHKILDGKPATQAAIECGFNDYSGFYKQFKKMFDKAPSAKDIRISI